MKVFEFPQYSDLWFKERRGKPSASAFKRIITPAKAEYSKAAISYAFELVGDLYDSLYPRKDSFATAAMRRGLEQEPESRRYYSMIRNEPVTEVGGCLSDCERFWSSPDGLVGEDGVLELKNLDPEAHVEHLYYGTLPDEFKVQVHAHLVVTGRKWCDLLAYLPGAPPLLVRTEPDEFTDKLRVCLEKFSVQFEEVKAKIAALAA